MLKLRRVVLPYTFFGTSVPSGRLDHFADELQTLFFLLYGHMHGITKKGEAEISPLVEVLKQASCETVLQVIKICLKRTEWCR